MTHTPQIEVSEFLEVMWSDCVGGKFSIERICDELLADCGVDAGGLSSNDFKEGLVASQDAKWSELYSSCEEYIATYSANKCTSEDLVRAFSAIVILFRAYLHGAGDPSISFDTILHLLFDNTSTCDPIHRMQLLLLCFRGAAEEYGNKQ